MKKLLNEWRQYLAEAKPVPGATTAAQLRDDPALSGYRSGEEKTVDIPADYGEDGGSQEDLAKEPEGGKALVQYIREKDRASAEALDKLALLLIPYQDARKAATETIRTALQDTKTLDYTDPVWRREAVSTRPIEIVDQAAEYLAYNPSPQEAEPTEEEV